MQRSPTEARAQRAVRAGIDDLEELFRGFADPTRLRILNVLTAGELCVCDIVGLLEVPQPTVSRHLAYLRRTRLIDGRRGWKYAYYRLADPTNPIHRKLINCVRSCFVGIDSLDLERRRAEARVRERGEKPCD